MSRESGGVHPSDLQRAIEAQRQQNRTPTRLLDGLRVMDPQRAADAQRAAEAMLSSSAGSSAHSLSSLNDQASEFYSPRLQKYPYLMGRGGGFIRPAYVNLIKHREE